MEPLLVKKQLIPMRESSSSRSRPLRLGAPLQQEQDVSRHRMPVGRPRGAPMVIILGLMVLGDLEEFVVVFEWGHKEHGRLAVQCYGGTGVLGRRPEINA